jgi:hypothetical protein
MSSVLHWMWGELFAHSGHRSKRLTRWLYLRYLATKPRVQR